MGRVNDTVNTLNTILRTILLIVLVGGAGYGGYLAYDFYHQPKRELADKQAELEALRYQTQADLAARERQIELLQKRLERLEVAMRLLKVRRRLARLSVLEQAEDEALGQLVSRVQFVEVNDEGQPIGQPKQFDIVGDLVYVDYLQVTFDDKYVEQSDLDRSTAICLFQRIFGERQEAVAGFQLDQIGTRPTAYARGTAMSDFEKKIWNDFWLIANDPERAAELGIYAAHGAAVSMRVRPGKTYEIELRATGEMTFRPLD